MNIKFKNYVLALSVISGIVFLNACSGNETKKEEDKKFDSNALFDSSAEAKKAAFDSKGVGKFTNVELAATLDKAMADAGTKIYDLKCSACHRLTNEKLVGPGWKDVTARRKAEWVMNFATNTDEMLTKDPAAQAMLEECLVRMPNQSLSDSDARNIYEFMRKNDGVK
ncbi:MAG: c-type cytochrome [Bacteroidia bacterium]